MIRWCEGYCEDEMVSSKHHKIYYEFKLYLWPSYTGCMSDFAGQSQYGYRNHITRIYSDGVQPYRPLSNMVKDVASRSGAGSFKICSLYLSCCA